MLDLINKILNPGLSSSGKLKLDFTDFKKLLRTSLFVGGAASTAYILTNIVGMDFDGPNTDTGVNTIIIAILTIVFEGVNRYFRDNSESKNG